MSASLLLCAFLFSAPASAQRPARVLSCDTRTVALDTSQANTNLVFYAGRSYGETFLAQDTVIQSITVWRSPDRPIDNTPLRLFITEVDSTGRPDVFRIVNSDLVIVIPPGDSIHSTPGVFAFSPPLALPHRGEFCFAVHDDLYCLDAQPLLASTLNPYPYGRAWKFTADVYCNFLGPPFGGQETEGQNDDMIFTVEFCDTSTPVRSRTWGELKTRYR